MDEKSTALRSCFLSFLNDTRLLMDNFQSAFTDAFAGESLPIRDKPPPADAPYAIGLLNALILRALILYQITKSAACFIGGLVTGAGRRHLRSVFAKKQIGGTKIAGLSQK